MLRILPRFLEGAIMMKQLSQFKHAVNRVDNTEETVSPVVYSVEVPRRKLEIIMYAVFWN